MHPKRSRFCLGAVLPMSMGGLLARAFWYFTLTEIQKTHWQLIAKFIGTPAPLQAFAQALAQANVPSQQLEQEAAAGCNVTSSARSISFSNKAINDFAAARGSCGGSAASSSGSLQAPGQSSALSECLR